MLQEGYCIEIIGYDGYEMVCSSLHNAILWNIEYLNNKSLYEGFGAIEMDQ